VGKPKTFHISKVAIAVYSYRNYTGIRSEERSKNMKVSLAVLACPEQDVGK
jgi:hypothetical protein